MNIMSKFRDFLRRTKREEDGSLTVDFVLVFPLLVWTVTGTFTFFDSFRQSSASIKAAYTVGDLISRETSGLNATYFQSLFLLAYRMVGNDAPMGMRVSLVLFDATKNRHFVRWSTHCGGYSGVWDDSNVAGLSNFLPPMPDQDTLIVVETTNDYVPAFNINWLPEDQTFDNFVFTRPRFNDKVAVANNLPDDFCGGSAAAVSTGGV